MRRDRARAGGLALAALLVATPAAAETIEVRPELSFQGSRSYEAAVAAHPGDVVRVDLPAQAGTGYTWSATVEGDAVQPGRSEKRPAARPGGPTREIMSYLAAAPGQARISFAYRRPWETTAAPARQVVVRVDVTEAPPQAEPSQGQ